MQSFTERQPVIDLREGTRTPGTDPSSKRETPGGRVDVNYGRYDGFIYSIKRDERNDPPKWYRIAVYQKNTAALSKLYPHRTHTVGFFANGEMARKMAQSTLRKGQYVSVRYALKSLPNPFPIIRRVEIRGGPRSQRPQLTIGELTAEDIFDP